MNDSTLEHARSIIRQACDASEHGDTDAVRAVLRMAASEGLLAAARVGREYIVRIDRMMVSTAPESRPSAPHLKMVNAAIRAATSQELEGEA